MSMVKEKGHLRGRWPSRRSPISPPAKLCLDSGEVTQEQSNSLPRTTSPIA
ncbi:hypothetical protein PIB30_001690 [Stylosanthes scabra]|uniref:Uncharacterized protein n=1 Tax=Stylosanthes scabra TaxID=79078 RepID=A0ABU6U5C8_9FABA|nr:hypothetical protein [Stylosanthes scabra]